MLPCSVPISPAISVGHGYGEVAAPEDLTDIPVPLKTDGKIMIDLTALF